VPLKHRWIELASIAVLSGTGPLSAGTVQEAETPSSYRMDLEELPNALSPASAHRQIISRETTPEGTRERFVVEGPSINGGYGVLLEVEEETVQVDDENSRFIRREYDTDPDGRQRLFRSVEERRVDRSDGSSEVERSVSAPDLNGRMVTERRETERRVEEGPGVFRTEREVQVPGLNSGSFVPSQRIEQTERVDADNRTLELGETMYSSPVGGQGWMVLHRREVSYEYSDDETRSVEQVYRPDGNGTLTLSDQVVNRTWTDAQGRERTTEETYARDIPGLARSTSPELYRQVDIVAEERPNGGREVTREIREFQVDRMRVVQRVIERTRPDGRGGTVTEREVQQADGNGRLQTVSVTTVNESGN
jgi:hypothetical protein